MPNQQKYERILDALQELLENHKLQSISVSEIAETAGIGKGSIYYYFPSKDAILEALVERSYEKPLQNLLNPKTIRIPARRRNLSCTRNISIISSQN